MLSPLSSAASRADATPEPAPVVVTGATGYVGGRLIPRLLEAGCRVRAVGRSLDRLRIRAWASHPAVELLEADILDRSALLRASQGCRVLYHLVHTTRPAQAAIAGLDLQGARNLSAAAAAGGVQRIIYLSDCLRPQAEIAEVLQAGPVPATVLRAALIVGSGSTSFEILRHLVERHPAMVVPRWIATPSYPIAIRNVLAYLIGCLQHEETSGETYDIGGPQVLTYRELMEIYAQEAGLPRPHILTVPVAVVGMSVYWIHLVTPVPSALARPLVEGLCYPPVRPDERLRAIVPQELLTTREAIRLALERIRRFEVETHWSDATRVPPAEWTSPGDPAWAGVTAFVDQRHMVVDASPEEVWQSLSRLGGQTGWYYGDVLWKIRGALDRLLGGIGHGRGRRDPVTLAPGDTVDFWRVADLRPPQKLVLVAEMRIPGRAWLEFQVRALGGGRTELVQSATFHPRGWLGMLYWYALFPLHQLLFRGMLRGIGQAVGTRIVSGPARLSSRRPAGTR